MSEDFSGPFGAQPAPPIPPPPPPPPPYYGPTGTASSAIPAGYVPYTGDAQARPTRGLGRAVLVLYWLTVGSVVLSIAAVYHRKSVVDDFISGSISRGDIAADDDRARALIGAAGLLQAGLMLAAAILTALWCRRIIRNAIAKGAGGLSVGKATFGWLPFAWWGVGFGQLRRATEWALKDPRTVRRWQMAFITTSGVSIVARTINGQSATPDQLSNSLNTVMFAVAATAALLGLAAVQASRAVRMLDETFSPE